jgi:cystathionine beta-synthase
MKENGFLDPEFSGSVADVLGIDQAETYQVAPSTPVAEVVALMKQHEISQVPLIDDGRVVGMVSEVNLLQALVHEGASGDAEVGAFAGMDFAILEPSNSATLLSELFRQGKTVIVQENGKLIGVLTKIDLIDYIARRMRQSS